MFSSFTWLTVAAIVVIYFIVSYKSKLPAPLPPGPKPKFFTGNLHQLPKTERWVAFKDWSNLYGPIFMYTVFGRKFIVLNSLKVANDLLEGRSNIYSDRALFWMYHKIIYRKLLHSGLNARAVNNYYNVMDQEACTLTENLIATPDDFINHFRRYAGAVVLHLAYGWTVTGTKDRFVVLTKEAFDLTMEIIGTPGKWMVDVFPFCAPRPKVRFIPSWFPGGSFKRKAEEYKKVLVAVDQIPYDWAKQTINSGNYIPSFTSQHLLPEDGHKLDAEEDDILKWCSSALYAGGTDTTVAFMTAFIAVMTLYPSIQETARREVDQVIGSRKPLFTDQNFMPYISALIKEIFRWAPITPLDTVTQPRDEDNYPNPEEFNPNRYLGPNPQLDPRKFTFGFGRRVCPGAVFAEASIFINVVNILSHFTISKAIDANGAEIVPKIEFVYKVTSHIKPFPCSIKPRTDKVF
ncbi:hypothetical protein Clacol_009427 [Clathrus columnatus]|uniref:Cytochrome P450 n=1 Tax=Clathrus columnatus TaxID=1419009 RepID=A0AAV5AKG6_9AGAM|nr:hypothetical protein Clacol_009427 [Clathrus columnatus]